MTAKDYLMKTLSDRNALLEEIDRTADLVRESMEKADREMDRLYVLQDRIRELANTLADEAERKVLTHRCFCNMSWKQVGEKLGISESAAKRRYQAALKHISLPPGQEEETDPCAFGCLAPQ